MKAQFFGSLSVDHIEGKWWRQRLGLGFYSAKYDVTIFCPAGFVHDFASVLRVPVAYLIAGNTGHWESIIHDLIYRFGLLPRLQGDFIFDEAGRVRSEMRTNQNMLLKSGRFIRTSLMTGAVITLGWTSYSPLPGCLDYRNRKKCGQKCYTCDNFYPNWKMCILPGFVPDIRRVHENSMG